MPIFNQPTQDALENVPEEFEIGSIRKEIGQILKVIEMARKYAKLPDLVSILVSLTLNQRLMNRPP